MAKWLKRDTKHAFVKRDSIVEKLAKVRGVKDLGEWFNPPERYLLDPYGLENIDEVAQRIIKAVHTGEKIVIMADVDADGVFACAGMFNYLKPMVEADRLQYIHSQRSRGHGVETVTTKFARSGNGVVEYIPDDTDLLIIVDSSANSVEACKYVKEEMGIDILIIDHHHIEMDNPYATMVNCQMGNYPNKYLSGSAMVWKVCHVIDDYMADDRADDVIDLATIGLISDMMSVRENENRHIIHHGLANINNIGLLQLLKLSKVDLGEDISTTTISFKISPAINSCTRYDRIELALELLTSDDIDEITMIAKEMIKLNEQRKAEESTIVESALSRVDNNHNVAVLVDNEIGSGFRGLVAMQLVSKLNKPSLVLKAFEDEDGNVTKYGGSARSIGNLPLKSICEDTRLFNFAQGHEGAFGVEIDADKLDDALKKFDEMIDDEDLQGEIYYDLELDESEINDMDMREIEKFSRIAGQGFPVPKFRVKGLVVDSRDVLGKDKRTIKISCDNGMACMMFRVDENYAMDIVEALEDDETFMVEIEVVGQLSINKFMNWKARKLVVTNQVLLDDYKIV
jgi:single-stranded-DNA-specific exonuclease